MNEWVLASGTALWLGILTSISPCPLATNLVAFSFVSQRVANPRRVALTGIAYSVGRSLAYLGLAGLIIASLLAIPDVAFFLEHYGNRTLGPLLVIVGLLLFGIIRIPFSVGGGLVQRTGERVANRGMLGALALGAIFALTFCPVSAALYFGSLLPLAMERSSPVWIPALYGIGTAAPVLGLALLTTAGVTAAQRAFTKLSQIEIWARRITAVVFIGVGIYFILNYNFELFNRYPVD